MAKFAKIDSKYLKTRQKISAEYGPQEIFSIVDHWPLYCGIANMGRYLHNMDLVRETLDVPGHIAEFGSWRGANLMLFAKMLEIFDPHGSKQVHCFDSFEGLTEFAAEDGDSTSNKGRYKGDLAELKKFMKLYELDDTIVIHKGIIEQTLPATLEASPGMNFSLVYCDVDLFEATRAIIENITPRLVKGGLLVMDEWNSDGYPGESIAVREFMEQAGDAYKMRHVRHARQPTLVLERV